MKTNLALVPIVCLNWLCGTEIFGDVLPPHFTLFSKTAAEYSAEWHQHDLSLSTNINPVFPVAGPLDPQIPVYFLMGARPVPAGQIRSFTVPENVYIFYPIITVHAECIDTPPPCTAEDLRDGAAAVMALLTELHASIDGVPVPALFERREMSPVFSVFFETADNTKTLAYGHPIMGLVDPIVSDGYWVMVEPLPVGLHVFNVGATLGPPVNDVSDTTFHINVVPANHPPVADASATQRRVIAPNDVEARVLLNGSRSKDPDNDRLEFQWLAQGASAPFAYGIVTAAILPVGVYPITLLVTDGRATNTATIQVEVITAGQAVENLTQLVQHAHFPKKHRLALLAHLKAAQVALAHDKCHAAARGLRGFQAKVRATVSSVDQATADILEQAAQEIIDALYAPKPTDLLPSVLPPNALVAGKTQAEWSAEWWKWAWTTSTNQNPFFDTNGVWAGMNQPEAEVFFLAGLDAISGTVARSIIVPEGKYLFLPVINSYCDNVDVIPPMTIEELRQCAAAQVNATTELHASLNGAAVTNLSAYRQMSPVFSFVHETADNLESWAAGHPVVGLIDPAVADGFYLMIEPLAPGIHVLNFGGSFGDVFQFTIDVTDTITLVPVPLEQKVEELLGKVEAANISAKRKQALEVTLLKAGASFEKSKLRAGIHRLQAFQHKVRAQLARLDPALADELAGAAQRIIEQATTQLSRCDDEHDDKRSDDDDDHGADREDGHDDDD